MAKIAILGFGTVGSGIAEVLDLNQEDIRRRTGQPAELKYILVRREFPGSPYCDRMVQDFSVIENDPEVKVVAECIGGCGAALDLTTRALKAGKHVVTANKALVASHGLELLNLAREHNCNFLFEASVGGGIPVLRPLTFCLCGNRIEEVCGIINGTTNYILTKMIREGLTFDEVLRDAQDRGYAEADPSADVDGVDTCRKLCILSALAFGQHVYPEKIFTQGIRDISAEDVAGAEALGRKIKLLGRALRQADGKLTLYVSPHLVASNSPLFSVEDVFNAVQIRGNAVGNVMFYGRGAGKLPTASAAVGDIVDCLLHDEARREIEWEEAKPEETGDFSSLPLRWYVRTDRPFNGTESVDGQPGAYVTAPLPFAQLDALRQGGLKMMSAIPLLD